MIFAQYFGAENEKKMIAYSGSKRIIKLFFFILKLNAMLFCEIRLLHEIHIDILNLDILSYERTCLAAYNMQLLRLYDYLANFSLTFERYN